MRDAMPRYVEFTVLRASCGQLPVVLGSAPARTLYELSFADTLDEATQRGYQRPFDRKHSREFRRYIEQPNATTIPLTFNLRGRAGTGWSLVQKRGASTASLRIRRPGASGPTVLVRVDCQHRLGSMQDSDVPLSFQCFLGLDLAAEMRIFNVINGKMRGLDPSLLDFHTTVLSAPGAIRLELLIAKRLHDDTQSVWHGSLKLGGVPTQGVHRRVSLRGLQSATRGLLVRSSLGADSQLGPLEKYAVVRAFWQAVANTWPEAWRRPRRHLLVKGVGVTALSLLGADVIEAANAQKQQLGLATFESYLARLSTLDWSSKGAFAPFGGRKGAGDLHRLLRSQLFTPTLAIERPA